MEWLSVCASPSTNRSVDVCGSSMSLCDPCRGPCHIQSTNEDANNNGSTSERPTSSWSVNSENPDPGHAKRIKPLDEPLHGFKTHSSSWKYNASLMKLPSEEEIHAQEKERLALAEKQQQDAIFAEARLIARQAEIKQGGRKVEKEDCAAAQKRCFDMKGRLSECWGHARHCKNRLSAGDLKRALEHSRMAKEILKLAKPSSQDDRADYEKVKAELEQLTYQVNDEVLKKARSRPSSTNSQQDLGLQSSLPAALH